MEKDSAAAADGADPGADKDLTWVCFPCTLPRVLLQIVHAYARPLLLLYSTRESPRIIIPSGGAHHSTIASMPKERHVLLPLERLHISLSWHTSSLCAIQFVLVLRSHRLGYGDLVRHVLCYCDDGHGAASGLVDVWVRDHPVLSTYDPRQHTLLIEHVSWRGSGGAPEHILSVSDIKWHIVTQ